jgi:hypothetical protein
MSSTFSPCRRPRVGARLAARWDGARAPHREHFDLRDRISQPGTRGLTAPSDPNEPDEGEPGQDLIAPANSSSVAHCNFVSPAAPSIR